MWRTLFTDLEAKILHISTSLTSHSHDLRPRKEASFKMVAILGSRNGSVVEHSPPTQASHQCGLGSIPGLGVKCGLSLLLVLVLAPRGFTPATPVFPSPQKPSFLNSNSIWNSRTTRLSVVLLNVTLVK